MRRPSNAAVAARAVELATGPRIGYDELDCQAFVEQCVNDCGGRMAYAGSNDMARHAAWLGTLENAKAEGRLVPGAGLLIHEDDESGLPAKYRGDGLGDFSHVGLYVGAGALEDVGKRGEPRMCDVVHSGATMGRVAGSTLGNGWTHVMWFSEIDYGVEVEPGVTASAPNAAKPSVRFANVFAADGGAVKLRRQASKSCTTYWLIPNGARVAIQRSRDGWALVTGVCTDGHRRRAWMLEDFLREER